MPGYAVESKFTGDGSEVLGALKAIAAQSKKTSGKMEAGFKRVGSVWRGTFAADMMGRAVASGMNLAQRGIESVVRSYVDYDAAIRQAADAGAISLEVGSKEFAAFDATARQIAATTRFAAADAAAALEQFGLAGYTAAQATAALPSAVQLATAAGIDLAAAAKLETDAMTAFGLTSTDAATQAMNLAHVNDVLAASADTSKLSTEELVGALKSSGPGFAGAGQSLETYTALLGKLTDSGMDGADAGSKLTFMLKALAAPSKAAQVQAKQLGISLYDEAGNVRDLVDFLADYDAATRDMTDAQRNAAAATIFGKRGLDGVNAVLGIGAENLKTYRDELKSAGGAAKKEAGVIEKSLGYRLDVLKNSATDLGMRFVEALSGDATGGIDELARALRDADVKPYADAAKWMFGTLKDGLLFLKDNTWIVKSLAGAFIAFKVTSGMRDLFGWARDMKVALAGTVAQVRSVKGLTALGDDVNAITGQGGGAAYGPATKANASGKMARVGAAASSATSALPVAVVGWAVGDAIATKLGDSGAEISRSQTSADNLIIKITDKLNWGKMSIDEAKVAVYQLSLMSKRMEEESSGFSGAWGRLAAAFVGAEDPIIENAKKQAEINALFAQMQVQLGLTSEQLRQLADAAAAGKNIANVDITVGGPGAGSVTTKSSTSGPNAPSVNVSQAGKN